MKVKEFIELFFKFKTKLLTFNSKIHKIEITEDSMQMIFYSTSVLQDSIDVMKELLNKYNNASYSFYFNSKLLMIEIRITFKFIQSNNPFNN